MEMTLPQEFIERIKTQLPESEWEAFLESYETDRSLGLRVNPLKVSGEVFLGWALFELRPVPWAKQGYFYDVKDRPGKHVLHEAGAYYIQEPSAMIVGELAAAKPGECVLDLCAAPGGKSTHLAGDLQGKGLLIANEIHPQRAQILSRNIERCGVTNAIVTNESPAHLAEAFPGFFDLIVVDAPCSGEGMFRKEEEALVNWSPENVTMCAARQKEILTQAMTMLRSGGRLVYSTCTFAPAEDEETISWLLNTYPNLRIKAPWHLPEGVSEGAIPGTIRMWPHRLHGEGHFACVLEDQSGVQIADPRKSTIASGLSELIRTAEGGKKHTEDLKAFEAFCNETLTKSYLETLSGQLIWFGDQLYLLPPKKVLLAGLSVKRAGLCLGEAKKGRFDPAHAWALSLNGSNVQCAVESPDAASYIEGNTMPAPDGWKGWCLITTNGLSLGWGKAAVGVIKNHYPKGLRKSGWENSNASRS